MRIVSTVELFARFFRGGCKADFLDSQRLTCRVHRNHVLHGDIWLRVDKHYESPGLMEANELV